MVHAGGALSTNRGGVGGRGRREGQEGTGGGAGGRGMRGQEEGQEGGVGGRGRREG